MDQGWLGLDGGSCGLSGRELWVRANIRGGYQGWALSNNGNAVSAIVLPFLDVPSCLVDGLSDTVKPDGGGAVLV